MNGCVRAAPMTTRRTGANKNDPRGGKYRVSLEGQLLDQKSLRAVTGETAGWNEIATDCIAFANAAGVRLLLGIANGQVAPTTSQQIDAINRLSNNVRPIGDSWAIESGRYVGIGPMNQRLLSTTGHQAREIKLDHLAAATYFRWLTPRA